MAASIFFSHSNRDRAWCELLAADAIKVGVTSYLAEHDPQPGTQLAEKIKKNIRRCDAFIVLLTHSTADSAYVHQEVGCALAAGKLVIPLVQPGIDQRQLAMLDGTEYIAFDFEDPRAGVEGFATAIRRVAEKQHRQSDVELLLTVALCVALLVVIRSDGGAGTGPT